MKHMDTHRSWPRPQIGISSCLLGNPVRYDGQHKRHAWLAEKLGPLVNWVPICPEVEMGLGIPRETIHLTASDASTPPNQARLETSHTHVDLTERAEQVVTRFLAEGKDFSGYIFKERSPSCGMSGLPVYESKTSSKLHHKGVGIFARAWIDRYPDLPMIEETELETAEQRAHFMTRLFAYEEMRKLGATEPTVSVSALQHFHQTYKLILMAHSPRQVHELGQLIADAKQLSDQELFLRYRSIFFQALQVPSHRNKRVNVLQHIAGYFRNERCASRELRQEINQSILDYQSGKTSFEIPLQLLRKWIRKFEIRYLADQRFLEPWPPGLGLEREL